MQKRRKFITVGIESSCDETACAVLDGRNTLLSNEVASSLKLHEKFGGVVPEIASRHCIEYIQPVFRAALKKANIQLRDIDLIGVTYGPGLVGSLLVGLTFAKALSYAIRKPYVGINHLKAHLYANFIQETMPTKPYIGLVISGGHTSIVYVRTSGTMKLLGQTRDDAVGEAFDKVAKMLGLGYPGGPIIEKRAREGDGNAVRFNCASLPGSYDFSFSGIKTAVLYHSQRSKDMEREIPDICASFQKAVVSRIISKTVQATHDYKIDQIVVGGGVSANRYLRERLLKEAAKRRIQVFFPGIRESIDNGAMVARYAYELYHKKGAKRIGSPFSLTAQANLSF